MFVFCGFADFSFELDLWDVRSLRLSLLNVISGGARFVLYGFADFSFERDLWGCSFPVILNVSLLNGISGGARFLWFCRLLL